MTQSKPTTVVDIFLDIVQVDSPTFHEQKMAKEVARRLKDMGLKAVIDKEGNVITKLRGVSSKETLMLNAHLDTVEPGSGIKPRIDNKGWIRSDGNTILGADNKTAVAAILAAVKRLTDEGIKPSRTLEIVFTVSEESGSHGAHGLDYSKVKSKVGYSFDVAGANFGDTIISAPFYNRIDIEIESKAGHAKDPEKAVNVIPIFAQALKGIKLGRVSENTLANIGIVNIGTAVNTIPGNLVLSGEVRSSVDKELVKVTNTITSTFKESAKKAGGKAKIKVTRENGGYKIKATDPFVKETLELLARFKIKPKLIDSFGCADANIFAEHGIKMLSISDGSLGAHTVDERIRVSDLQKLGDLIYLIVTKQ